MFYIVYKITNQIDGKIYIGIHKTKDLNDKYMGSGKYLKHAQEKYGIDKFTKEILFVYDNPQEMYSKEAELVNEDFLTLENTYNLKIGGSGGWDIINNDKNHFTHSTEHSYYMKKRLKEKMKDEHFRKNVCENISNGLRNKIKNDPVFLQKRREHIKTVTFKGKKHNSETKVKMSISMKGEQAGDRNSQHGTVWVTNGIENKKIQKSQNIPEGFIKGRIMARGQDGNAADC